VTLVFVDDVGGGLASLAASIATSRGLSARAESSVALVAVPEVETVLREIGVAVVSAAERARGEIASAEERVTVGAGAGGIDVKLYAGPATTEFGGTELERIGLARIARDRIERYLDRRGG